MGKYIYEGHMGNFFTTNEKWDYNQLYCDSCGDSDTFIGYAENAEEAWNLLKPLTNTFNETICEKCEHKDDYEYCNDNCKEYEKSFGRFGISYVMNFIYEEFKPKNIHKVYLICRKKNNNNYIFVNFQPFGYKFGDKHSIPHGVTLDEEFVNCIANNLLLLTDGEEPPVFCTSPIVKKVKNETIHIFQCKEDMSKTEEWKDRASYHGDGWYGYAPIESLKLLNDEKCIERILNFKNLPDKTFK